MKWFGIALIVLGCVSLAYGGIRYSRRHTFLEVGDVKASTTEHKRIPIPPVAGVILLVTGAAIVVTGGRRTNRP